MQLKSSFEAGRFGATAEVVPGGSALLVGIGGRLVVVCAAAAMDCGLRHVVVPNADDACVLMQQLRPRVVVMPASIDRGERERVLATAASIDAEVVDLPGVLSPAGVAHAVAHALAIGEARRADARGPSTQRAPSYPEPSSRRKRDEER